MNKQTLLVALAGLALRLVVIFPGPLESKVEMLSNKADLRNYYAPAQSVLGGENPYALWASGQLDGARADMTPLELGIFVATVALWTDPHVLQILFALCDAANVVLLGILFRASTLMMPFQVFYAFGPLTLYNLTFVPQDKTILLALTLLLFIFLAHRTMSIAFYVSRFRISIPNSIAIIFVAGLIAAFKWLSVFYLLPLLLFVSRDAREFVKHGIVFASIVALAHLPWFPSWAYVYQFRAARFAAPFHISPGVLFNALGVYSPALMLGLLAISLLTVYGLFWKMRIDIFETIALATTAGIFWTPDMDPVHLSLIAISFLLITNWASARRLVVIWGLSFIVAAIYAVTTHDAFGSFPTVQLQALTGAYASPRMILFSYALFVAVFAFYLRDKTRGQTVGGAVLAPGLEVE